MPKLQQQNKDHTEMFIQLVVIQASAIQTFLLADMQQ